MPVYDAVNRVQSNGICYLSMRLRKQKYLILKERNVRYSQIIRRFFTDQLFKFGPIRLLQCRGIPRH